MIGLHNSVHTIDTSGIKEGIVGLEKRLEQFRFEYKDKINQSTQLFKTTVNNKLNEIKACEKNFHLSTADLAEYSDQLDRELKAITIIQQEVDDLAAIRDNAAKIKKQNEDLLLKLKLELSAKLDEIKRREESIIVQQELNRYEIEAYESLLGLKVTRPRSITDERNPIKLVFTKIDVHNMEKKFCITIDPNDANKVLDCKPEIPALEQLRSELKGNGDFNAFLKKIRTEFANLSINNTQ